MVAKRPLAAARAMDNGIPGIPESPQLPDSHVENWCCLHPRRVIKGLRSLVSARVRCGVSPLTLHRVHYLQSALVLPIRCRHLLRADVFVERLGEDRIVDHQQREPMPLTMNSLSLTVDPIRNGEVLAC